MERGEYIKCRREDKIGSIIYSYYEEKSSERGHPTLTPESFMQLFRMWKGSKNAIEKVLHEEDIRHDLRILQDKKGKEIKYL